MITALDHIVLICPDLQAGVQAYSTLLGADPVWQAQATGQASALFQVQNTALELIAPAGDGETADALRALTAQGAKLTSLVYRSDDVTEDHRLMQRRGLDPSAIGPGASQHRDTGAERRWQKYRIPDAKMAGVKTFVLQSDMQMQTHNHIEGRGHVQSLDHVVITTANPDRVVANYGSRLGLRLALDRTVEAFKTRFLFFRLGDLTLEIVHRLDADLDARSDDTIWGITWQTDDLQAAHTRLTDAGVTVSEIRTGRKPGSQVFTAKSNTLGIPTLFIQHTRA